MIGYDRLHAGPLPGALSAIADGAALVWFVLVHVVTFVIDLLTIPRRIEHNTDREILLVRHQVRVLQRGRPPSPRLSRWEKLTLAVLTARLSPPIAGPRARLEQVLVLVKPETVRTWHREVVRRTWTMRPTATGGRPATPTDVDVLVRRVAQDNPGWGYRRMQGERIKLGQRVSHTTVRAILWRHGLLPAPERGHRGGTWRAFLSRH